MLGRINVVAAGLLLASAVTASPAYPLYAYPLPIPANASPSKSVVIDGTPIDFYEMTMEDFTRQVYPDLGPANMVGYNGVAPGPTFWVKRGTQTVVRFHNQQTRNCSVHLHGSDTHAPWDGWADDMIAPGMFKDYYYPNDHKARSIWYHDHANHVTAMNAYGGLGGIYIIYDPADDALGLPSGDYDVPLALQDRTYGSNGDLVLPQSEGINQFGDVLEVNGQPWPFKEVEPRKYRFRIFDMSLSRPYNLYLQDENGDKVGFQVIASDCGLFSSPVSSQDLQIAPGERYEIVVDFASASGKNITMMNQMDGGPLGEIRTYDNSDQIMRFVVGTSVSDTSNNGDVPNSLDPNITWPESTTEVSHVFDFQNGGDARWTINGVDYDDVNNRVLARPVQGSTELWQVNYDGGPGVHPVHVHLVSFQIISRTGGSRGVLPYEAAGLKDIVLLEPGESATILAQYGPWNGLYMFHCHNLIHEDNAMMAAFNITALSSLGYDAMEDFAEPSDARFDARQVEDNSYDDDQISSTLSYLAGLHAYDSTYSGSVSTSAGSAGNATAVSASSTSTGSSGSGTVAATATATTATATAYMGRQRKSYTATRSYGSKWTSAPTRNYEPKWTSVHKA